MTAPAIKQAFVLGAGLGTRLRPLTDDFPKPLVPIFQKPLITFAFDHLLSLGCERFVVNTHHLPHRFAEVFPTSTYCERPIAFRHEPLLLETAGGLANVADLLSDEPFIVYNGDTLTDLPIEPVIEEHFRAGNIVTLALRSGGGPLHIAFDRRRNQVVDIRNRIGTGAPDEFLFTGIYVVDPKFVTELKPGVKRSVIRHFLDLIRRGKLGGVIVDEGNWWDVGTRVAYLGLHRDLPRLRFPLYNTVDGTEWRTAVHETAVIEDAAQLRGCTVIGANAHVGSGAKLDDTIVWAGAKIASQSELQACIVRSHRTVSGAHRNIDI